MKENIGQSSQSVISSWYKLVPAVINDFPTGHNLQEKLLVSFWNVPGGQTAERERRRERNSVFLFAKESKEEIVVVVVEYVVSSHLNMLLAHLNS